LFCQKFISRNQKPEDVKAENVNVENEQRLETADSGADPSAAEDAYADDNFAKTENDEGNEIEVILENEDDDAECEQAAGGDEIHDDDPHEGGDLYEGADGGYEPQVHDDDYNNEVDYDEEGAAFVDDAAGAQDA
jgi:hypothetical protein